jgi:hypothetical protein
MLPRGTACLNWQSVPIEDEISAITREYDELLSGVVETIARAELLLERQDAIDTQIEESKRVDCVCVIVKQADFRTSFRPDFRRKILSAARMSLSAPTIEKPLVAFQAKLTGRYHDLEVGEAAVAALASAGSLNDIRLVLFPALALEAEHFNETEMQFHETVFQHEIWRSWEPETPKPDLLKWPSKKLKSAIHNLWAFRYWNSFSPTAREAFHAPFAKWAVKHTTKPRVEYFSHWNGDKNHEKCSRAAEQMFKEIFPRAELVGDKMWRKTMRS